jgi:hypothetical protein
MKGITSGFLIALLTNRNFGIWHIDPVDLSTVLRPSTFLNWTTEYPKDRSQLVVVRIKDKPPRKGHDVITQMPLDVWLETNQDLLSYIHTLPLYEELLSSMGIGTECDDLSCIYGCLHDTLFVAGDAIKRNITDLNTEHPKFISVQIRTGGAEISGWSDPLRTSHYVVQRQWDTVERILRSRCPLCDLFLTTDSSSTQRSARLRYGTLLFTTQRSITHSDRSYSNAAAIGFPKVVLDNWLLGEGQYAVISNSGFSYTAMWRVKRNCTVVRMNKLRTGYYVEEHLFLSPSASWRVINAPFIAL